MRPTAEATGNLGGRRQETDCSGPHVLDNNDMQYAIRIRAIHKGGSLSKLKADRLTVKGADEVVFLHHSGHRLQGEQSIPDYQRPEDLCGRAISRNKPPRIMDGPRQYGKGYDAAAADEHCKPTIRPTVQPGDACNLNPDAS